MVVWLHDDEDYDDNENVDDNDNDEDDDDGEGVDDDDNNDDDNYDYGDDDDMKNWRKKDILWVVLEIKFGWPLFSNSHQIYVGGRPWNPQYCLIEVK